MAEKFEKYGYKFPDTWHPLQVEMWAIQQGAEWCKAQGLNLSYHYEEFRKIVWPKLDDHRWHRLCRDEILNNKVTVLLGPGSSGKTNEAAWIYLVDYWCHQNETCVLVSSTDIRGLKKRVWGEITMLWQEGVDRFDFLGGHLLDSALAITTDDIEDCEPGQRKIRDMRKGIFGVPCIQGGKFIGLSKFVGIKQKRMRLIADEACFPRGTLVDTPFGSRPIEQLEEGDLVLNALGVAVVKRTMKKRSTRLVKITTKSGDSILCTPTHPFFTQKGWVCACNLNQSHYMVSTNETMCLLSESIPTHKPGLGLQEMFGKKEGFNLQAMRETLQKEIPPDYKTVLQPFMFFPPSAFRPGVSQEVLHKEKINEDLENKDGVLQATSRKAGGTEIKAVYRHGAIHEFSYCETETNSERQHEQDFEANGAQAKDSWREWNRPNQGGNSFNKNTAPVQMEKQLPCKNWNEGWKWIPNVLQARFSIAGNKVWSGSGWQFSWNGFTQISGCKKDEILDGSWVDSVKIQEQKDSGATRSSKGGIDVYNLEIEGHPSYSINGFLVHNSMMGETFLSAFSNLNKNEDFQAIVLGNPNDPLDPLGRAAEPLEGWTDEYMEPNKTKVWQTRFMGGTCVNLIGTDSPNFDYPEDKPVRYKYLISRQKIKDTLSFFAKDSIEYYSQCIGSMKIGTMAKRVLTRELCIKNKALEDVVWSGKETTKVYFVDTSYGGDNCVAGWGEFGEDADGNIILSYNEPKIIPILTNIGKEPEYQIAEFVKNDCEEQDIPPDHMGHDSTGRGSLGTALAKVWSAETHPIESGGIPSDRPVCMDLYVTDEETGQRRFKTCREEYDRKVTEFWYQVRFAVEASQIRNLPEECLHDLCTRKWDRIKRDIKSVEPKDRPSSDPNKQGMKQRTGKSPDHGDWAAGILEMARRKSFQISKLANPETERPGNQALLDAEREIENVLKESLLTHA